MTSLIGCDDSIPLAIMLHEIDPGFTPAPSSMQAKNGILLCHRIEVEQVYPIDRCHTPMNPNAIHFDLLRSEYHLVLIFSRLIPIQCLVIHSAPDPLVPVAVW